MRGGPAAGLSAEDLEPMALLLEEAGIEAAGPDTTDRPRPVVQTCRGASAA